MQPVIETLNEISAAVIHLRRHLRLLRGVLGLLDQELVIDATGIVGLIESMSLVPTVNACFKPPRLPVLNACNGVVFEPGTTRLSVGDLIAVTERAMVWCEAIEGAIGQPIEIEESGPTDP